MSESLLTKVKVCNLHCPFKSAVVLPFTLSFEKDNEGRQTTRLVMVCSLQNETCWHGRAYWTTHKDLCHGQSIKRSWPNGGLICSEHTHHGKGKYAKLQLHLKVRVPRKWHRLMTRIRSMHIKVNVYLNIKDISCYSHAAAVMRLTMHAVVHNSCIHLNQQSCFISLSQQQIKD